MSKDYYKILGVEKNANQEDIKKGFRKLAHQHHPDKKSGDEAKFKEINEAYQTLSDPKKRAQYDQFGSDFGQYSQPSGSSGFEGFSGFNGGFNINMDDLGDILSDFGDSFGFSNRGGGGQRGRASRGRDIQVVLSIDFIEAVFGVEKEISLKKTIKCTRCKGEGMEPGTTVITCKTCNGSGHIVKVQRTIFGNMQVQMTCGDCGGEGKTFKEKCTACHGIGIVNELVNFKVKIPAGINNNETIRLSGNGEAGAKNGQPGDLYLKIRVNPDRRFERDGVNIKSQVKISFSQAALGGKIEVITVDGLVDLKIPEGTQSGRVFILRNKGVSHLNSHYRGDHLVEVIVKTPTNLNRKQKEVLKEFGL
ncbi:MAG: molecular chaperone DnaJ [Patescibacteria group bacterium]|nr:molecular chaperone DnaJ [Patescibacteria group bacterium]MBU0879738.1 molecular chaperone DnaJ [Patescibacteria group bacterium]MBU0880316.1 molecular chaperone DnaJ [Patescibacteria group bacterium]MBU1062687.1 molecular chaperone DnaJ [Patescibacteria group bacterium]MBU1783552.1 molecular chaperone DnaJ [Patescibacteria group bacterium]